VKTSVKGVKNIVLLNISLGRLQRNLPGYPKPRHCGGLPGVLTLRTWSDQTLAVVRRGARDQQAGSNRPRGRRAREWGSGRVPAESVATAFPADQRCAAAGVFFWAVRGEGRVAAGEVGVVEGDWSAWAASC